MNGDIEYVADTYLIERVIKSIAGTDDNFVKEAQLGSVLDSIAGSIKSYVGSQIHGQDSGGITRTLVNLFAPATFFRLPPLMGVMMTAAQLLGVDLYSIFQRISSAIMPSIQAGQPVSPDVINNAAKSAVGVTTTASLLDPLYEIEKTAQWGKSSKFQNETPLVRMFGFLGKKRGGSLLAGIIGWFFKTILLSAGMLAVGGAVGGALGFQTGQKAPSEYDSVQQSAQSEQVNFISSQPSFNTGPNQSAMYSYRPNSDDIWIEALNGQQPHERLLQWISEAYPDLYQYQDIIVKVPSFWQGVRGISRDWIPGKNQMSVPQPYKTRNDILSLFINDIFREIQKGTQ
jgi:hypothetical protein